MNPRRTHIYVGTEQRTSNAYEEYNGIYGTNESTLHSRTPSNTKEHLTTNNQGYNQQQAQQPQEPNKITPQETSPSNSNQRHSRIQASPGLPSSQPHHEINILYANANGIRSKRESLQIALHETRADIALLCETHLKPGATITIPGFVTTTKNRKTKQKGGLAIMIKKELQSNACIIKGPESRECMWIRINAANPTFICCFYGKTEDSPQESIEEDFRTLANDVIEYNQQGEVIIIGDFNAKIGYPSESVITKNGQRLIHLCRHTDLNILNMADQCEGVWTRRDPITGNTAVLDYVLATAQIATQVSSIIIDEEGEFRIRQLRGKKTESDHNTIIVKLKAEIAKWTTPPIYKWRMNENTNWENFRRETNHLFAEEDQTTAYSQWENRVIQAAHTTIGSRKVNKKPNPSKALKQARANKKAAKKNLNQIKTTTQKDQPSELTEAQQKYRDAKSAVEETMCQEETDRAQRALNRVIQEGGVNSKAFWNLKRKALRNGEDMTCIKDITGKREFEPTRIKDRVADFYEELYATNPNQFGNPTHTWLVEQRVQELRENRRFETELNTPFEWREMQEVIRNLPRGKSAGPNRVCYEFIIHGGHKLQKALLNVCESVRRTEDVPDKWQHLSIVMLPKGTKDPEDLNNKRGISLSDVAGKVFERLILKRTENVLEFTEAQAGARKGRSTTDQIFMLKALIRDRQAQGKETYLAFLDLHKAYDKVWKAAILLNLWKKGIRGKMWRLMDKLNTNLTAQIKTRFGPTRPIQITESLRQGGVLSGPEFASLIDLCETVLQDLEMGIPLGDDTIATLLLMDDIVLTADSAEQLQEMLNIMDTFANKWHLVFNQQKSKIMIVKRPSIYEPNHTSRLQKRPSKKTNTWKLGQLTLDETSEYTYLGEVLTDNGSLLPHIKHMQTKMYTHINRTKRTGSQAALSRIKMNTYWQLHDRCMIPAVLYNCESWILTPDDETRIDNLQSTAMQQYLKTPRSTPKLAYIAETGMLPLSATVHSRQLAYLWKLLNVESRAANALRTQRYNNTPYSWYKYISSILTRYSLPGEEYITTHNKATWKKDVGRAIRIETNRRYRIAAARLTKMVKGINMTKQEPRKEKYITQLSRKQASAVFRLRSKTTLAEANMCSSANTPICKRCNIGYASDTHLFTRCTQTTKERSKWSIQDLSELYKEDPDISILRSYAEFAIDIGIVPQHSD